jgi:hypothetical protein
MFRHGFIARTIAETYGVALITIQDIVQGRSWRNVPVVEVPPPVLQPDIAVKLRLRAFNRLPSQVKIALDHYRKQLAAHFESTAEHERFAVRLFNDWVPRRPHVKGRPRRAANV